MVAGSVAGFVVFLAALAWTARPQMEQSPPPPAPEDVQALRAALEATLDPANPQRFQVEVDYAQGSKAAWFPKAESPLLTDLVQEGKLPPLVERVGPEPIVYRGPDGIGRYGGTWVTGGSSLGQKAPTLVRWSPEGFPIVPHFAKSWEASPDYKTYTFHLRRGMRWSDGHPFTADDIMYWWEHEATDKRISGAIPPLMTIRGKPGTVEKVDDDTVRFVFPEPHGLFVPMLAMFHGVQVVGSPAHYLRPYHPDPAIGNADLIAKEMALRRLPSARDLYLQVKLDANTEHPRLWPWLYRTFTANAPYSYVRNPYYCMVDTEGNQLPYVDQVYSIEIARDMMASALAGGRFTMGTSKSVDYTLILSLRKDGDYRVLRWLRADRCDAMIHVNLNRRVEPGDKHTEWKHKFLNHAKFRQALSVAIDRQAIIRSIYFGETIPAQCAPGPNSFFHHEASYTNYTQFDPALANRWLDEIGLDRRDANGIRIAPDGTRLTFFLHYWGGLQPGTAQFIVDDWARVGIHAIPKLQASALFYSSKAGLQHDFTMWTGENELIPILSPRVFIPEQQEANFAIGYANWYQRGGMFGSPEADKPGCIPIPTGHPLYTALQAYEEVKATGDRLRQREHFNTVLDIAASNTWTIGICTSPKYVVNVQNGFSNVTSKAAVTFSFLSPGNTGMETYYFADARHTPEQAAAIKKEITTTTPEPRTCAAVAKAKGAAGPTWLGRTIQWTLIGVAVAFVLMAAIRHPYIGRRLLIMAPTLFFISIVVFSIIQLPPGDFLTSKIMELQMKGDAVDEQELANIKAMYHMDDPMVIRYCRWMGLAWFFSFDAKDEGLLQGNLGRSMATNREVSQSVGDRITLTILLSLGSILFTWAIALPVGIYSAVRQYSVADYVLTFVGFIGMCIPSFLLAVVLMYGAQESFGMQISGLFSPKYAMQPYWDWPKFVDLMNHLWIPVIILGIGGTGGMIRVMRGNLLDELKKPYVVTARAKGVRPAKLLFKYPVRIALNPFISSIGGLFPALISGGALISVVLSLPTVGPMMLDALMNEDTLLAGSMLMVLSVLGVLGVLISDLLLLWLDPRIRFEGGSR